MLDAAEAYGRQSTLRWFSKDRLLNWVRWDYVVSLEARELLEEITPLRRAFHAAWAVDQTRRPSSLLRQLDAQYHRLVEGRQKEAARILRSRKVRKLLLDTALAAVPSEGSTHGQAALREPASRGLLASAEEHSMSFFGVPRNWPYFTGTLMPADDAALAIWADSASVDSCAPEDLLDQMNVPLNAPVLLLNYLIIPAAARGARWGRKFAAGIHQWGRTRRAQGTLLIAGHLETGPTAHWWEARGFAALDYEAPAPQIMWLPARKNVQQ